MNLLCLDTSCKQLIIGLYRDGELIAGCVKDAFKQQSEMVFVELISLMQKANMKVDDLSAVMITKGPGSYTGVRIAMSIAKVLCTQKGLSLYMISTLQLYAGLAQNALVLLDARSDRAYMGILSKGSFKVEPCIQTISQIEDITIQQAYAVFGDGELIHCQPQTSQFLKNFADLFSLAEKVENIHLITPCYLKKNDAYKVVK